MISVCMASYNGEKYIEEQLRSILKQLSPQDEVVISDDGSTDNTIDIVNNIGDSRIKLYVNKGVHGFTPNFENAIRHAKGDVIFLSDQDDIWAENKVKRTMEALKNSDMIISDCVTVNSNLKVLQSSRFEAFHIRPGFFPHLIKSRYIGCCMAFNRKVKDVALPFPKKYSLVEHDIWLAAVGFLYFNVELIREPLIYYRRHGNNISDGGFEKGYSLLNKIYRRVYRLMALVKIFPKAKRMKKEH